LLKPFPGGISARGEAINEGLPLFYKAMQPDPEFASAHAMAARVIAGGR
jgi:hypothetical protein